MQPPEPAIPEYLLVISLSVIMKYTRRRNCRITGLLAGVEVPQERLLGFTVSSNNTNLSAWRLEIALPLQASSENAILGSVTLL